MSAPPPGYYVPAVLFFDETEELDEPAIQAHILRLAEVYIILHFPPNRSHKLS